MSERVLPDWLGAYLKYTEDTEPPTSYHTWTGTSMLAGALQRKVWLQWGHETLYPNMYIILVGPSGRCRKGTAMGMGRDLLEHVQTVQISSESITREALIRFMKDAVSTMQDPETGKTLFHCSITTVSPELSVFLGQQNLGFLADLTDWFDSNNVWTYETKGSGTDRIQGVCFNLLGATAPDWIQSMIPQEALGGGFTSRCIFVVEATKKKTVAEPMAVDQKLRAALIGDLERIGNMQGEFKFDESGRKAYVEWYIQEEKNIERGESPIQDPRFAGYVERRTTHIRKLSLVMSACRSEDYLITAEDFNRARALLQSAEMNMANVFGGLGQARYSEVTERVLLYIKQRKKVLRSDLMQAFYRDVDSYTLKIIEEVLEQMKVVHISIDPLKNERVYTYINK